MRRILQIATWLALAGTVVPSILYLAGQLDLRQVQWGMLWAMIGWFVLAPPWMGRKPAR